MKLLKMPSLFVALLLSIPIFTPCLSMNGHKKANPSAGVHLITGNGHRFISSPVMRSPRPRITRGRNTRHLHTHRVCHPEETPTICTADEARFRLHLIRTSNPLIEMGYALLRKNEDFYERRVHRQEKKPPISEAEARVHSSLIGTSNPLIEMGYELLRKNKNAQKHSVKPFQQ